MKTLNYLYTCLFILLTIVACNDSDFRPVTPGVSRDSSLLKFNHASIEMKSCGTCHEAARPHTIPPHGDNLDCLECHRSPVGNPIKRPWLDLKKFTHNASIRSCNQCHMTEKRDSRPNPKTEHPSKKYSGIDCIYCHQFKAPQNNWKDITFNHKTHNPEPISCQECHEVTRPDSHIHNPKTSGMKSTDCISCHGSYSNWNEKIKKFDHQNSNPATCIQCHKNDGPAPAEKHPSFKEMYNKLDCGLCHTFNIANGDDKMKWSVIKFNHKTHKVNSDNISCLVCHKEKNISTPVSGSHAKNSRANLNCKECHAFDEKNEKGWKLFTPFNHQKAENGETCESCHSEKSSISHKTNTHVKTKFECGECHKNNAWKPATFTHDKEDTNCKTCHDNKMAKGLSLNHFKTENECSKCHSQKEFKNVIEKTHKIEDTTNCLTCHDGKTAQKGKTVNHVKSDKNCSVCHSKDAWKPATFLHGKEDTNCKECHNNQTAKGLTVNHFNVTQECSICHSTKNFKPVIAKTHDVEKIDNCLNCHDGKKFVTPKNLTHVQTQQNCKVCHSVNAWKPAIYVHDIVDINCSSCHDGKTAKGFIQKHIPTTLQCSSCHTNKEFKPVSAKTHAVESVQNINNCQNCHSEKTTATPKNAKHLPTTLNCSACHIAQAWKPATYVHSDTDSNCLSCHDGKIGKGLSKNHIQTSNQCSVCHSTKEFKKTIASSHSKENIKNCTLCHNGQTFAKGKTESHVKTNLDCGSCHSLNAWKPALYKHNPEDTQCLTCHNGSTASARPKTHTLTTAAQCSVCHDQDKWARKSYNYRYKHNVNGNMPEIVLSGRLQTHKDLNKCSSCHEDKTDSVKYTQKEFAPTCLGCHQKEFVNDDYHRGFGSATMKNCLKCHSYDTWEMNK